MPPRRDSASVEMPMEASRIAAQPAGGSRSPTNAQAPRATSSGASPRARSEEHTSELQSLMRNSYAVFCLKKNKLTKPHNHHPDTTTYQIKQHRSCHKIQ